MKYRVKIDRQEFEVFIDDIRARPVIAVINEERFEVWPTNEPGQIISTTNPAPTAVSGAIVSSKSTSAPAGRNSEKRVMAPLPGVVISIAVQVGAEVAPGQELLVIEAMKMKNSIRASKAGLIASILVSPGQAVQYSDVLLEYGE